MPLTPQEAIKKYPNEKIKCKRHNTAIKFEDMSWIGKEAFLNGFDTVESLPCLLTEKDNWNN